MANKKKQRNIIIGILIILAIYTVSQGGLGFLSITDPPNLCNGQVITIDPALELTYSNELQKEVILAIYSTLPSSECLNIRLSEEQLEDEFEYFDAFGNVLFDIELVEQRKIFNIQQENEIFREFDINNVGYWTICADWLCEDLGYPNVFASIRSGGVFSDCYCISDSDRGFGGDFLLTEGIEWEADVKLGDLNTLTLTHEQLSGTISNVAYVEWAGNLQSNIDFSGLVGQKDTYASYSNNIWRMISQGTFNSLNNNYNNRRNDLISCEDDGGINCDFEIGNAFGYNTLLLQSTQDQTWDWAQSEPAVDYATIQSNQLIAVLQSPIVYPIFRIYIDAEEVGIFQSVGGEPDVTCPPDFDIESGETVIMPLSVRNTGSNQGTYEYFVSCDDGSQFLSPQPPQNIAGYQILNIQGTFGFTVPEGTDTAYCSFTAMEQTSGEEDSCDFEYDSTHVGACTEGEMTCEAGNTELWTCLADGTYDIEECPFGCSIVGGPHCIEQGEECEDDSDCDEGYVCIDGECVEGGLCETCFSWLYGQISEENQCTAKIYYERIWYNPMTWILPEGGITQSMVCPIFFVILVVIGVLVILLFVLIFKVMGKPPRRLRK